ncbi:transaldolase [Streptomyces olivoverticillatus]|uniref:Transaldolase n=1 Tax=Streptomyces olivoverticillatus TaxID=66427 RepID=A0A7W7LSP7_9ACTN|nr:transaldolase [Streptomyces olivoverticillatus]MBB4895529.1 transaldolase [Streptomyces olivoverticillatus]
MTGDVLERLTTAGVSVWLDDLTRDRLADGSLAALVRSRRVTGATSDPSMLAKSLCDSPFYAGQLDDLAHRGVRAEQALRLVTTHDIRWACDILRPVHEATGGADGLVSVGIDPRLAHDAGATLAEARELWRVTGRANVMVRIPATDAGLTALSACLAEGINADATLILSADRYDLVADACFEGLERAHRAGLPLAGISSVASFLVGRIDSAVDTLLDREGTLEARAMHGTAAVSGARLAHERHERTYRGARWRALAALGARPQRLLWADTTVRNPAYHDTRYVDRLVTRGTVNTMPPATLQAVADHGSVVPRRWTEETYDDARRLLGHLQWFGIDHGELVLRLESEALKQADDSWHQLLDALTLALDKDRQTP